TRKSIDEQCPALGGPHSRWMEDQRRLDHSRWPAAFLLAAERRNTHTDLWSAAAQPCRHAEARLRVRDQLAEQLHRESERLSVPGSVYARQCSTRHWEHTDSVLLREQLVHRQGIRAFQQI